MNEKEKEIGFDAPWVDFSERRQMLGEQLFAFRITTSLFFFFCLLFVNRAFLFYFFSLFFFPPPFSSKNTHKCAWLETEMRIFQAMSLLFFPIVFNL